MADIHVLYKLYCDKYPKPKHKKFKKVAETHLIRYLGERNFDMDADELHNALYFMHCLLSGQDVLYRNK